VSSTLPVAPHSNVCEPWASTAVTVTPWAVSEVVICSSSDPRSRLQVLSIAQVSSAVGGSFVTAGSMRAHPDMVTTIAADARIALVNRAVVIVVLIPGASSAILRSCRDRSRTVAD